MEASLTILTTGANATGYSSVLNVLTVHPLTNEKKVIDIYEMIKVNQTNTCSYRSLPPSYSMPEIQPPSFVMSTKLSLIASAGL